MRPRQIAPHAQRERALQAWRGVVGADHVVVAPDALTQAATATFPTSADVLAVLTPGTRDEVRDCVRIARDTGVPLYPVSTGKNWGYGSGAPPSHAVVLHLGRLSRIVDFDEKLGHVTVEPGVTQWQLQQFLLDRGSRLRVNGTGATPHASLIGNALDRGIGMGPYGDHVTMSCAYEVVLGTGEVLRTGFARFDGAVASRVSRHGVGPSFEGIFAQWGGGVVTEMTFWLEREPEVPQRCLFDLNRSADLPLLVDLLQDLESGGRAPGGVKILSSHRVLSLLDHEVAATAVAAPGAPGVSSSLCSALRIGAWSGSVDLSCEGPGRASELSRAVTAALADVVDGMAVVDCGPVSAHLADLRAIRPWFALETTRQPHLGSPPDPGGLVWFAPALPYDGRTVAEVVAVIRDVCAQHEIVEDLGLTSLSPRLLVLTAALRFDVLQPEAAARALLCHDRLQRTLADAGVHPYRLALPGMRPEQWPRDPYGRLARAVKRAVDPAGIVAPGRYEIYG